jgi:hypothetical protein
MPSQMRVTVVASITACVLSGGVAAWAQGASSILVRPGGGSSDAAEVSTTLDPAVEAQASSGVAPSTNASVDVLGVTSLVPGAVVETTVASAATAPAVAPTATALTYVPMAPTTLAPTVPQATVPRTTVPPTTTAPVNTTTRPTTSTTRPTTTTQPTTTTEPEDD